MSDQVAVLMPTVKTRQPLSTTDNSRVNANHFSFRIHHGSAGVTRVERCIALNYIVYQPARGGT